MIRSARLRATSVPNCLFVTLLDRVGASAKAIGYPADPKARAPSDRTVTVATEFTRGYAGAKPGYSARRSKERAIAGLYAWNRTIVMSALDHAVDDGGKAAAAIGRLSEKLTPTISSAELAACTGELFSAVVARTGRKDIVELIEETNARMHDVRVQECARLDDAASELQGICELLLNEYTDKNRGRLREAITVYHKRRRSLVPEICEILATR